MTTTASHNVADDAIRAWLEQNQLLERYMNDTPFHTAVQIIRQVLAAVATVTYREHMAPPATVYAQCLEALYELRPQEAAEQERLLREFARHTPTLPWQQEVTPDAGQ